MLEKTNELGEIRFDKGVIESIVRNAANEWDGRVSLHNFKGKYKPSIPGNEIVFAETPDGMEIAAFVVIKFGTSINGCCNRMIEKIREDVKSALGEDVKSVKIIVTGIQSREIARRHIEFAG